MNHSDTSIEVNGQVFRVIETTNNDGHVEMTVHPYNHPSVAHPVLERFTGKDENEVRREMMLYLEQYVAAHPSTTIATP